MTALTGSQRGAPVVEAEGLTRAFGGRRAVDEISFTLHGGECLALFGPNGAGKSTLLRLLAGLLAPSRGSCLVGGVSLRAGQAARSNVGIVSHASMLYGALTARENLEFTARMFGLSDPTSAAMRALTTMRVADRADAPVRALSRGLQQRVSIARAIVHSPGLLLCDEPYTGLDETGSAALTAVLGERRAQGAGMIVVTHNLAEGLALGTHAAVMRRGRFARYDARESVDADTYGAAYRELATVDG
ncbi:MAG: heme ABC exporter ATP-binding protein CcmA [Gemmatimonadaceae bacterium]|nr:heme ABC exporter ATP-binding protein CcmA [Gemmatimonadaceae bacterium]